ncbi:MAG: putative IIA-like nitrogen-regulatory protein PtsN [Deltaproteobacteria bacterium]|nr:putative IIA-like nitrogen-regulatory protein PtsN [Deltaproteobacteria bacterium]
MQIATLKEVSLFLKVKESTLYSWAEKGCIPASKLNGLWRFDMDEIREWFRNSIKRPVKVDMAINAKSAPIRTPIPA